MEKCDLVQGYWNFNATIASIVYGLNKTSSSNPEPNVSIFDFSDFGGDTFDISIILIDDDVFSIYLDASFDNFIKMVKLKLKMVNAIWKKWIDRMRKQKFKTQHRTSKQTLSIPKTRVNIKNYALLVRGKMNKSDVDDVVLVDGSKKTIKRLFSAQAAALPGDHVLIVDVTPVSLGMGTDVIAIAKNLIEINKIMSFKLIILLYTNSVNENVIIICNCNNIEKLQEDSDNHNSVKLIFFFYCLSMLMIISLV